MWAQPPPSDEAVRLELKTKPKLEFIDERNIVTDKQERGGQSY